MLSLDLCDEHPCQFVRGFRYRGNKSPISRSWLNLRANCQKYTIQVGVHDLPNRLNQAPLIAHSGNSILVSAGLATEDT